MIVRTGTRDRTVAVFDLPAAPACPACHRTHCLRAMLVSRSMHFYGIPFVPFERLVVVQCQQCGTAWNTYNAPPGLAPTMQALRTQVRHPYWTWTGLALAALVLAGVLAYYIRDYHNDEALLEYPAAGDVYTVRSDSSRTYSLLKVRQASGNAVELVANKYETSERFPDWQIRQDSCYSDEPFTLTRFDLQIMRRKGQIVNVDRP